MSLYKVFLEANSRSVSAMSVAGSLRAPSPSVRGSTSGAQETPALNPSGRGLQQTPKRTSNFGKTLFEFQNKHFLACKTARQETDDESEDEVMILDQSASNSESRVENSESRVGISNGKQVLHKIWKNRQKTLKLF